MQLMQIVLYIILNPIIKRAIQIYFHTFLFEDLVYNGQ